jgi:hypothetical protein
VDCGYRTAAVIIVGVRGRLTKADVGRVGTVVRMVGGWCVVMSATPQPSIREECGQGQGQGRVGVRVRIRVKVTGVRAGRYKFVDRRE